MKSASTPRAQKTHPAARESQPDATSPRAENTHAPGGKWTFLTNHSHVLILLARNPSLVLREVATQVGITERAVQRIIADLEEGGYIERERVGRRNHYRIVTDRPLRHPVEAHRKIGDLLSTIDEQRSATS